MPITDLIWGGRMTIRELIENLQRLGVSSTANIVIWDDRNHEYEITNVDSVLADEVVFDIKRTKLDYQGS